MEDRKAMSDKMIDDYLANLTAPIFSAPTSTFIGYMSTTGITNVTVASQTSQWTWSIPQHLTQTTGNATSQNGI